MDDGCVGCDRIGGRQTDVLTYCIISSVELGHSVMETFVAGGAVGQAGGGV